MIPPSPPGMEAQTGHSIESLEKEKQQIHEFISKVDAAQHAGKISAAQRDTIVAHYYGTADTRVILSVYDDRIAEFRKPEPDETVKKTTLLIAGFSFIVIAMFATLFFSTGGLTGAVVYNTQYNAAYTENTVLNISLDGATRINASGTASGDGDVLITLIAEGQRYTLYNFSHGPPTTAHASLPKPRYAEGEEIVYNATSVSGAYLMTADQLIPLDASNMTISGLTQGNYSIKLIINDTGALSQEVLPFTVVPRGEPAPNETFDSCGEACNVNITANATVEIAISGATLTLNELSYSTQANRAPVLLHPIGDVNATGIATVDIASAFSDPDGDPMMFDTSRHDGLTEVVTNGTLTVSGPPGPYSYIAYASDGKELTPSNIFIVTLLPAENVTVNATVNETVSANSTENATSTTNITLNTSENTTSNTGNETANITTNTADCSNPNPNLRPIECLTENASRFFASDVYLEDVDHNAVGRLTPLGNLLIRGRAYQNSTGQPGDRDFTISYDDTDQNRVVTIWIDKNGDLRLRGRVIEENTNLVPPPGSYAVINRKGVYLAYADTYAGDLYLRGNIIMFREDIK